MQKTKFSNIFNITKPIIGMIHLPTLPGYKGHKGMSYVVQHALKDLETLQKGGINGVMLENEHDHPHQVVVGPEVVAAMTIVVNEVIKCSSVPVGLEVLLNDPKASLAIAKVTGAKYIRIDYFVDRMAREEYGGEMYINPTEVADFKRKIKAFDVAIFADVQVKYATLLEEGKTITKSVKQAISAGADAIVVTGNFSGEAPNLEKLKQAKLAAGDFPVLVGSGFSFVNARDLLNYSDGAIVGTAFKTSGKLALKKIKQITSIDRSS